MKVNCSLILSPIVLIISPLSTGLCDESRNLLFYLYTLQSKTLTITNDVDVSITKYFLERRWQINVINKGWFFFSLKENLCYFVSLYLPKTSTFTLKCVNFVNFVNFFLKNPTAFAMGSYFYSAEFIRWLRSLQTKPRPLQSRATSWASRRGLRGLETRLLWFAMRLLS